MSSNNLYSATGGATSVTQFVSTILPRNPSFDDLTDINGPFKKGQRWINSLNNVEFFFDGTTTLNGIVRANWQPLSASYPSGTSVETLTVPSGPDHVVYPSANNINFVAGTNMTISGDNSSNSITFDASLSGPPLTFQTDAGSTNADISNVIDLNGLIIGPQISNIATSVPVPGVVQIAIDPPVVVPNGGTGVITIPEFQVLCGGTVDDGPIQPVGSTGTKGQVLASQGSGVLPHWVDSNLPSPLRVPGGGTGRTSLDENRLLAGGTPSAPPPSSTNDVQSVALGAVGTLLQGTGALPNWTTAIYPSTTAQGDLLVSSGINDITTLAKDTNATRYLSNTGTNNNPAWSQVNLTNGVTGLLPGGSGGTGVGNLPIHQVPVGNNSSFNFIPAGSPGQILTSHGSASDPTFENFAAGNGGGGILAVQVFTTSGTYIPTPGMTKCIVEVVGGGGGGGGGNGIIDPEIGIIGIGGGGGGGGGYARKLFTNTQIGTSQPVTIGDGGLAGAGAGIGGDGGTTSLGTLIGATGGGGGEFDVDYGALGGQGFGGDFNTHGGDGGNQQTGFPGGFGGSTFFGGGARTSASYNGEPGRSYGGGGSGGTGGVPFYPGGAGFPGIIVITEYATATIIPILGQQVFPTSGTYIPTPGVSHVMIEVVGAGGGGGGTQAGTLDAGSGGGGGEYRRGMFTISQVGASQSITIGAAGVGGPGTGTANQIGTAGGDTSVGSLIIARGGQPGISAAFSATKTAVGGIGGTGGTGGILAVPGSPGGNASANAFASSGYGGPGGMYSETTSGYNFQLAGNHANGSDSMAFGGGGAGGAKFNDATTVSGGHGYTGLCIITEYATPTTTPILGQKVYISTDYYVPTPGTTFAMVEVVGAGGGSAGGSDTGSLGGSGGGGGGYAKKLISIADIGASQLITIGVGGTAGAANGSGGDGGVTSFGSLISASGGSGGIVGVDSGSFGGHGFGGDINVDGSDSGGPSGYQSHAGGFGGGSFYAGIRRENAQSNPGEVGHLYGGGANGGGGLPTAHPGAAGAWGVCVVTEYSTATGSSSTLVRRVFTSNGTYTPTPGMYQCDIEVVGGGGGGGAAYHVFASQTNAGAGGGGGGYAKKLFTAFQIGTSQHVEIGIGGAGGVAGTNPGSTGGTTFVGATAGTALLRATGGTGGNYGVRDNSGDHTTHASAGVGGSGALGDFNTVGSPGQIGTSLEVGAQLIVAGGGGSSFFGGGGLPQTTYSGSGPGSSAFSYGGGGGGAFGTNADTGQAGGNGFAGIVIITEYLR